ncbi:SGNH/GDSL hydrolase family protein [Streptomyces natalensis]|nr:SGNH/GDSL hydrolase family protein [Streptomyces natalensis]
MSTAVVTALVLALTMATPAGAAPPPGLGPVGKSVALGSSFAAGPGIPPRQPGSPAGCGRSRNNYASVVARHDELDLHDVSCSGADTNNILTAPQGGRPPQIRAVTRDTALVTITIGGNDVEYLGSLTAYSCQNSQGKNCAAVDQNRINRELRSVASSIGKVVDAVHRRAPDARVLLVNYLTILPLTGPVCDGVPLTDDQVWFERLVASRLEAATDEAARRHDARVVNAATASRQHHACSSDPWVERYRTQPGRTPYHPNKTGMSKVASLVEATIDAGHGR